MYLSEIKLKHFRNYADVSVKFSPHTNVLLGQNAQGKTNLLEAIYYLALARSHRTTNERELITFDHDGATVAGIVHKRYATVNLALRLSRHGKNALVNHLEQKRLSTYVGQMNVILFAPEDLNLIKGAPGIRRRFIDMEYGQIDATYLYALGKYKQILKQRNKYIKLLAFHQTTDRLYLRVLSEQLASVAAVIIAKRVRFLAQLEHFASRVQQEITQAKENLAFTYVSGVDLPNTQLGNESLVAKTLVKQYHEIADKEIARKTTLVGPHRDDLIVTLNGKNVQTYGSQGQQRTCVLAIKLAEIDVMHHHTGEYPLLLLDDVLSELDGQRQTHLLKTIQHKVQTFLTTPALSDVALQLIDQPNILTVKHGTLSGNGVKQVVVNAEQQATKAQQTTAELIKQVTHLAQKRNQSNHGMRRVVRYYPHQLATYFPKPKGGASS